jgi:hypothetical protein
MRKLATDRSTKEFPQEELNGKTPREVLIEVSEEVIKPVYGKDYFGKRVIDEMPDSKKVYLLSDGGFPEELHGIMEKIGPENLMVIRIMSEGKTFDNDSRRYLRKEDVPGVKIVDIQNNFDDRFLADFKNIVDDFIGHVVEYPQYKPMPGQTIEQAVSKAIQELKGKFEKNDYMYMKFNDTDIYIGNNATIDGVISAFSNNINREIVVNE